MNGTLAFLREELEHLRNELNRESGTREVDIVELRRLISGEKLARSEHSNTVQELLAAEKTAREAQVAELMAMDKGLCDAYEGQVQKQGLQQEASLERISYLEELLKESAARHDNGIAEMGAAVKEQLEAFKTQVTCEIGAREADVIEFRRLLGGEKIAFEEHRGSVQRLLAAEKAAREAHAKELLASEERQLRECAERERQLREAHRVSVDERVGTLERFLKETTEKHAEELLSGQSCVNDAVNHHYDLFQGRFEQFHGEIGELRGLVDAAELSREEQRCSARDLAALVGSYETHHGKVMDHLEFEKGKREAYYASVDERVAYMEELLNDALEQLLNILGPSRFRRRDIRGSSQVALPDGANGAGDAKETPISPNGISTCSTGELLFAASACP